MGVRGWLLRQAALRPRVLVVASPYGTRTRLLVEMEVARRGWPVASSPAEASLVVVCGEPGPGLAEAVREVWHAVTVPRALVELPADTTAPAVGSALTAAVHALGDETAEGHGSGRERETPGGVAMAERGPDRDGLKLDRLHVPLGPVLVDWPAGLVVETVLQGDVIQRATARMVGGGPPGRWEPYGGMGLAAARLDSLGRLLAVAGWPAAARDARRLRDRLLTEPDDDALPRARFARRVRRSRVLRWMLRGLGPIGPQAPPHLRGDALDRLRRWTHEAEGPAEASAPIRGETVLEMLPALLTGAELAAARLIVAGLDPHLGPSGAPDGGEPGRGGGTVAPGGGGSPGGRDVVDGTGARGSSGAGGGCGG